MCAAAAKLLNCCRASSLQLADIQLPLRSLVDL